jgi:IS30 family transposase
MRYRQLTAEQRYALAKFKQQGFSQAAIARALGCHPSTISRELKRTRAKKGASLQGKPGDARSTSALPAQLALR